LFVHPPEFGQFRRQGKNNLHGSGIKHLGSLLIEPSLPRSGGATGATPMSARVVVNLFNVTVFATLDMPTQEGGFAMG
jgi:hypothetical protein